ncbi:MAG: hypothetical protein BalsKO_13390 [Balneolaceae bacterium]
MEDVDFVPLAIYIDYSKGNKPDLLISIGDSINVNSKKEKKEITSLFEESVHHLLIDIKSKLNQ